MDKRIYYTAAVITLMVALVLSPLMSSLGIQSGSSSDSTKSIGNPCFIIERLDGSVESWCKKNNVTNIARNQTRDIRMNALTTGQNTTWNILNLSTDTNQPFMTDTVCTSTIFANGLQPVNGSVAKLDTTIANYSITYKWTATAQQAINKVCLSNGTSGSALMASACLNSPCSTATTLNNNENLTVIYYIAET